jgi:hypothetical protein
MLLLCIDQDGIGFSLLDIVIVMNSLCVLSHIHTPSLSLSSGRRLRPLRTLHRRRLVVARTAAAVARRVAAPPRRAQQCESVRTQGATACGRRHLGATARYAFVRRCVFVCVRLSVVYSMIKGTCFTHPSFARHFVLTLTCITMRPVALSFRCVSPSRSQPTHAQARTCVRHWPKSSLPC